MESIKGNPTDFRKLRQQAEAWLRTKDDDVSRKNSDKLQELIQELEVHQVELEMQNEELRSAQLELAESRDNYQELYDFAPVGYFTFDENFRIRQVNLSGAELLSLSKSELINTRFSRFVSPDFQSDYYAHCKQISENGTPGACDLKLVNPSGGSFYARLFSTAVKDEAAASKKFQTTLTDITELAQARQVLQEREFKFRQLFNQMVSASALFEVVVDKQGKPVDYRYIEVNSSFETYTGIQREQVLGKTLLEVFPETENYWMKCLEDTALTGKFQEIENYFQELGRYYHLTGFRPTKNQVAVTFFDITDFVLTKQALQDAHDKLEKRVKERTIELALSNSSLAREIAERQRISYRFLNAQEDERRRIALELHDELGQDLSVLKLEIDILKSLLPRHPIELHGSIENALGILNQTIEKVRGISRELIPSVLISLGLAPALRSLVENTAAKSNFVISSDIHLPKGLFQPDQQVVIYRIFQEIIANIRKHSQATQVSVNVGIENHGAFFRVEDDGIGFDIEQLKSISIAERGLGLPSIAERVKMLDGSYKIHSHKGSGTQVAFQIPITSSPE